MARPVRLRPRRLCVGARRSGVLHQHACPPWLTPTRFTRPCEPYPRRWQPRVPRPCTRCSKSCGGKGGREGGRSEAARSEVRGRLPGDLLSRRSRLSAPKASSEPARRIFARRRRRISDRQISGNIYLPRLKSDRFIYQGGSRVREKSELQTSRSNPVDIKTFTATLDREEK